MQHIPFVLLDFPFQFFNLFEKEFVLRLQVFDDLNMLVVLMLEIGNDVIIEDAELVLKHLDLFVLAINNFLNSRL